ncbi:MAG: prepilin-type N-terminal cleavage/methylation domain-containing protein [Cyanobacteria bacterium J06627_8]
MTFKQRSRHDDGLTLMECLVAIVVVALTGALITPPLFLAAATRIQNRRAEQALQIAQGEIDRIRSLVEQGEHNVGNLPAVVPDVTVAGAPTTIGASIRTVNNTCLNIYDNLTIPATTLLPIDTDGDCQSDFFLQSFRTRGGLVAVNQQPSDFEVGVRVYASNIATNAGTLRPGLQTTEASLQFTTGEGNQRQFPMAVLYTDVTWDGSGVSLFCYHNAAACTSP